jgi:hypothetical protein
MVPLHQPPVCLSPLTDRIQIDFEIKQFVVQALDGDAFDGLFVALNDQFACGSTTTTVTDWPCRVRLT